MEESFEATLSSGRQARTPTRSRRIWELKLLTAWLPLFLAMFTHYVLIFAFNLFEPTC